jgi:hypothetical protein
MQSSRATGTIAIITEFDLNKGEISAVRIIANRDDQEQAARQIVAEIIKPSRVGWLRRLFQRNRV